MKAGVRNKISGKIVEIKQGDIMSEVVIQMEDSNQLQVTSVMTTDSLQEADFKIGDTATALIKAINVVLVK